MTLEMEFLKWFLAAALLIGSTSGQQNLFFPGSPNSQAQNSPSIQSISSRIANRLKSTPKPNEERRILEAPKPSEVTTPTPFSSARTFDLNPQYQFSTPSPLNDNNFFQSSPQFFSNLNQPGLFGNSPFGLNDFNFQGASFPSFNSAPDTSIFNSGTNQNSNNNQPKSYHYRRDYNDKDGYSPWRDVVSGSTKRIPVPTQGQGRFQQSSNQLANFPSPNFHQKFDLGPEGFFNFEKKQDVKKNENNGYSDKTLAIMKIEPTGRQFKSSNLNKNFEGFGKGNEQSSFENNRNDLNNDFNLNNLAQSFRSLKWPGQN